MFLKDQWRVPDGAFLLNAGISWLAGAAVFLLAAALAANVTGIGELGMGYISSAISFLAAFIAGISVARRRSAARLPAALTTATTLVIVLLTVGFLIHGEGMNSSAILSIVSFTYAGVVAGVFISPEKKYNGKKYRSSKLT